MGDRGRCRTFDRSPSIISDRNGEGSACTGSSSAPLPARRRLVAHSSHHRTRYGVKNVFIYAETHIGLEYVCMCESVFAIDAGCVCELISFTNARICVCELVGLAYPRCARQLRCMAFRMSDEHLGGDYTRRTPSAPSARVCVCTYVLSGALSKFKAMRSSEYHKLCTSVCVCMYSGGPI